MLPRHVGRAPQRVQGERKVACKRPSWARGNVVMKNSVSVDTRLSRPPEKLQYGPRIHTVQHSYYNVCATEYDILARLVPTETPCSQKKSPRTQGPALRLECSVAEESGVSNSWVGRNTGTHIINCSFYFVMQYNLAYFARK